MGINSCGRSKHSDCSFFFTTVTSRWKNQWYIVSQLVLAKNIRQAWLLVFLPTKLSVSLKKIFFVSLKSTKITSKIQISEVCGHVTYSFINILFISTEIFDDKLCPQILAVGTTANSPLSKKRSLYEFWIPKIWKSSITESINHKN
jgi:hypothetical protein